MQRLNAFLLPALRVKVSILAAASGGDAAEAEKAAAAQLAAMTREGRYVRDIWS